MVVVVSGLELVLFFRILAASVRVEIPLEIFFFFLLEEMVRASSDAGYCMLAFAVYFPWLLTETLVKCSFDLESDCFGRSAVSSM